MITAILLVIFALLALVFFVRLAKGRHAVYGRPEELAGKIQPVNVEAFRNLMDPAEEDYLRRNLSRADFKVIQRERLRAALEYISCVAQNAAALTRMGEAARHSPEPSIAEAGERVVHSAVRLRILTLQARGKIYVGILFPSRRAFPTGVADTYERMTGLVFALGRLQHPTRGASAAL